MSRKSLELSLTSTIDLCSSVNENQELFEACKTGDLAKVKKLINPKTVNARDLSGRRSTALHFSAGKFILMTMMIAKFYKKKTLFFQRRCNENVFFF